VYVKIRPQCGKEAKPICLPLPINPSARHFFYFKKNALSLSLSLSLSLLSLCLSASLSAYVSVCVSIPSSLHPSEYIRRRLSYVLYMYASQHTILGFICIILSYVYVDCRMYHIIIHYVIYCIIQYVLYCIIQYVLYCRMYT
jgi:hypothetical protein